MMCPKYWKVLAKKQPSVESDLVEPEDVNGQAGLSGEGEHEGEGVLQVLYRFHGQCEFFS